MSQGFALGPVDPGDPAFIAEKFGFFRGKPALVWHIMGRRGGTGASDFASTSALNDMVNFLGTGNALIPADPAGANIEIISSSASDTNTGPGTGAQKVLLSYLNSTGDFTQAEFTMNGATAVNIGTAVYSVLWAEVSAVGSNEVSVGNIDIRNVTTPTTIYERINAGGNRSLSGRVKVPTGYSAFIQHVGYESISADGDFRLRAQRFASTNAISTVYHFLETSVTPSNTTNMVPLPYLKVPAGAIIKVSVIPSSSAAGVRMDTHFSLILVKE
jgi:hypothetical protein